MDTSAAPKAQATAHDNAKTPALQQTQSAMGSALVLAGFQVLAMVLPILTLPLLARALGVAVFGQIMLAQFVVLFAVVFVDSGLNAESQRRAALAQTPVQQAQVLIDNQLLRLVLSLILVPVVLGAGALMPGLPWWMVAVALLHLLGTVMFPQWWFVAQRDTLRLGVANVLGRLLSAGVVLAWVRSPADAGLALVAGSAATLVSGLLVTRKWYQASFSFWGDLDHHGWRRLGGQVRGVLLSGFIASSAQSAPGVILGWIAGTAPVGLFTAADRLTRAAAHVASMGSQMLLNVAARWHHEKDSSADATTRQVLRLVALACTLGAAFNAWIASWVIDFLYGAAFADSVAILRSLGLWLAGFVLRNVWLTMGWSARGALKDLARLQWLEGLLVAGLAALGAWWAQGLGVALALVLRECLLLAWMIYLTARQGAGLRRAVRHD